MNNSNQPKTVLITGAAKRIGRAIALEMAQHGWDIVVHYDHSEHEARETVHEILAIGQRACALRCDLSDEAAIKTLLPNAVSALGPIQCLVNNASLFEYDHADNFSTAQLHQHMQINLAAPILLAHTLFQMTPTDQQGVVVNLLDQKLFNLNPDFLSYTLSKAALHTATTLLAQTLAPRIRVVGVAPGITCASSTQTQAEFEKAHAITPLGYASTPNGVARTVRFVAEHKEITGTTLLVDGGQHLTPLERDVMFIHK